MVQTGQSKGQLSDFCGATHQEEEMVTPTVKESSWSAIPMVDPEGERLQGLRVLRTAAATPAGLEGEVSYQPLFSSLKT